MSHIVDTIKKITPLKKYEGDLIAKHFVAEEKAADEIFVEVGDIPRYVYFLSSGIVKGFQYGENGKLIVEHLLGPGYFFTSHESFINQTASPETYQAVTDCRVFKISWFNAEILSEQTEFWQLLVNKVMNDILVCKMERIQDFQFLTATERYLKLLENQPDLAARVSVNDLASYLGIEPPSLSRIRKQVAI
ncbi:MAG: Crp/Fnr family transcriptional regulator [Bacteroidota bacterium]